MGALYFSSSVPKFKAALLDRLRSVPDLFDVTLSRGNPYPVAWGWEAITIGAATNRTWVSVAAMTQVDEQYDVDLLANRISAPQDPHEQNEDRAYELMDIAAGSVWEWVTGPSPLVSGDWGFVQVVTMYPAYDREGMNEEPNSGKVTARDAAVILPLHVIARLLKNG